MNINKIKLFIKNIISSMISACIDLTMFYLLSSCFKREYHYLFLATVIARLISGGINFLLNRNYVFESKGEVKKEFISYLTLFIVIMLSSSFLVATISMKLMSVNQTIVKVCVDLVLFIVSFIVQNKFIFKERKNNI